MIGFGKLSRCIVYFFVFVLLSSGGRKVFALDWYQFYTEFTGSPVFDMQLDMNLTTSGDYIDMMPSSGTIRGESGSNFINLLGVTSSGSGRYGFNVNTHQLFFYGNIGFENFAFDILSSSVSFENSNISFINSRFSGGGISNNYYSSITFTNSIVSFISGSAIVFSISTLSFENSIVNFTSNTANGVGAILAGNGANLIIKNSSISFIGNNNGGNYDNGGGIYIEGGSDDTTLTLENSSISFIGNSAGLGKGGAIYIGYIESSSLKFLDIGFIGNNAAEGGALFTVSEVSFENSRVNFIENSASDYGVGPGLGGAISNGKGYGVLFKNSSVSFSSNSADNGGAIYLMSNNTLFENSSVSWMGNSASNYGGAIYFEYASLSFKNSSINFTQNSVISNSGGAIYSTNYSVASFENSLVSFSSNSAAAEGGAIYVNGGVGPNLLFENSTIAFIGNSAGDDGGAIFLNSGSSAQFINSYAEFSSNTANGVYNDIYFNDSQLYISGGILISNSGIAGNALSLSTINITNAGNLEINADSNKFFGNINIGANSRVKVRASYIKGDTFLQTANSVIELTTGALLEQDSSVFFDNVNSEMFITSDLSTITFYIGSVISNGGVDYGKITKDGEGILRISGDNSMFGGYYEQNKGLTIVESAGKIFGGEIHIEEGSSITAYGAGINYGDLYLNSGYVENYASGNGSIITDDNTRLQNGSTIVYKSANADFKPYEFQGVQLMGGGSDKNKLIFEGIKLNIGSTTHVGLNSPKVSLHFKDSVLALSMTSLSDDPAVKASLAQVRNIDISKISADTAFISFGVDFIGASAMTSDKLTVSQAADVLTEFNIEQIFILNLIRGENLSIDDTIPYYSEVFSVGSNLAFAGGAQYAYTEGATLLSFIASDGGTGEPTNRFISLLYDYDLLYFRHATGDFRIGISTISIGADRSYVFLENEEYHIINSFGYENKNTGGGNFTIEGNGNPESRIISARLRSSVTAQGSLFDLSSNVATKFNINRVTIRDAYRADGGAAIKMTANDNINLNNVIFLDNTSSLGGAIYASTGTINITNASKFQRNIALASGGAIYASAISVYYQGIIDFSKNTAASSGGFAYFKDSTNVFTGVNIVFGNNIAENGGALYIEGGNIYSSNLNNKLTFTGNTALSSGGAAYIDGGTSGISVFDIGDAVLTNNTAGGDGGAIYFDGGIAGSSLVLTNPQISNNSSSGLGGAIYAAGGVQISTLTIRADKTNVLFSANSAGGGANDIYLGANMDLVFNASEKMTIRLDGGIKSAAGAAIMIKTGLGEVSIGGVLDYSGALTIEEGTFHINTSNSNLGSMNITENGNLSLLNNYDESDKQNIVEISGDAFIGGDYSLDLNFRYPHLTDYIHAAGTITINNTMEILKTNIWGGAQFITVGNKVLIAKSDFPIAGNFIDEIYGRAGRVLWESNKESKELWLVVKGIIDFTEIAQTHNQKEVAGIFNKDSLWESSMINIPNMIGDMFFEKRYDEVRKAYDQLSGAFYPNVLKSGAISVGIDSLYARMRPKEKAESRIWGEYYLAGNYYGADGNLNGDFSNNMQGGRIGWDIYANNTDILGIYARYASNKYKQGPDRSNGIDIEVGVYSGLLSETKLDFKWNVSLALQSYDVKREISFADRGIYPGGLYPESSFNTFSARFGFESGYNIPISKGMIKPFIGLRGGVAMSPEIKEKNGDEANLLVDAANYLRIEILFGSLWKTKIDQWNPYVKVFGSYLAAGQIPENEITFQRAPEAGDMKIQGVREGPLGAGISAGVEYEINPDLSAYTNLTGQMGFGDNDYFGYYANIGISMKIGGEPQPEPEQKSEPVIEPASAPASEPEPEPIVEAPPLASSPNLAQAKERRKNAVMSFKMSATTFQSGSSKLSPAAKASIRKMADKMKTMEYNKITIEGHTDSLGKMANNMTLSRNRAKAVMMELISNGISSGKLDFIGFASNMPVQSNKTPKGRQANRRVEIFVE
ncbi:MAG: OmpA family protein [Endomicrobium sp.]|jgi:predicted outer membrane repeat protein|nr:OmpA family protein [Endomicrobium sp.]